MAVFRCPTGVFSTTCAVYGEGYEEGWWLLSGHSSSRHAEHWQLKSGALGFIPGECRSLLLHLITANMCVFKSWVVNEAFLLSRTIFSTIHTRSCHDVLSPFSSVIMHTFFTYMPLANYIPRRFLAQREAY